jgi:hypothetical protein
MWSRPSVWGLSFDLGRKVCGAALALPLLVLSAGHPTHAQVVDTRTAAEAKAELADRVQDVTRMFQADPRYSRGKTPEQVQDGVEFVTGNVLFVLAHEVGHALIREMELPVLGKEEDAADALATVVAVKMASAFADRVIINAARGWFLSDQRDKKDGVATVYYDEHGMDLQRAYNIVCLLVGADRKKYEGVANEVKLPEERQATCRDDWVNASWSWQQVLKPHMRQPEEPKTKIEVKYNPPGEDYKALSEIGQKLQILETIAAWLSDDFKWKVPVSVEMEICGESGARWEWKNRRIIVCYEIIREFSQLFRDYGQMALVPGAMHMSKNKKYEVSARNAKAKNAKAKSANAKSAKRPTQKSSKAFRTNR